ncbi:hypothetical protein [Flagellimonas marinaquae]|uniref:hypothetical protein n=1 Tax=Flagellimonas marinaquae TaxID=254955 RepID=UPI002075364F|nr:hypothetical protein [Allomuricauda aquimarina]USD26888.1 hypothetical protein MJO53_08315 [Allomuricauda aquimarina]
MKPQDRLILIFFSIFLIFVSCKESVKKEKSIKANESLLLNYVDIVLKNNCLKINELSNFYSEIRMLCKGTNKEITHLFSKGLEEHYKQGFCDLFNDAIKNLDGEIQYKIDEDCNGVVSIISVENILDEDGEKYRNEYATFLYIKKEKGELKIYNIGGAG